MNSKIQKWCERYENPSIATNGICSSCPFYGDDNGRTGECATSFKDEYSCEDVQKLLYKKYSACIKLGLI